MNEEMLLLLSRKRNAFSHLFDKKKGKCLYRYFKMQGVAGKEKIILSIEPLEFPVTHILFFGHWYEPSAKDSNRTEFEEEAAKYCLYGIRSILFETLWSDIDWFLKREHKDDFKNSCDETSDVVQIIDYFRNEINNNSLLHYGFIGHDYGAMYGLAAVSCFNIFSLFIFMAGTDKQKNWYYYFPEIREESKELYEKKMKVFDPDYIVKSMKIKQFVNQFGISDPHVSAESAQNFEKSIPFPYTTFHYDCGHSLNENAAQKRDEIIKSWVLMN